MFTKLIPYLGCIVHPAFLGAIAKLGSELHMYTILSSCGLSWFHSIQFDLLFFVYWYSHFMSELALFEIHFSGIDLTRKKILQKNGDPSFSIRWEAQPTLKHVNED